MPKMAPGNGPRGANEPGTGHGPGAGRAAGSAAGAANAEGSHHGRDRQTLQIDTAGTAYEVEWVLAGKRQGKGRGGGGYSRTAHTKPAATPAAPGRGALPHKPTAPERNMDWRGPEHGTEADTSLPGADRMQNQGMKTGDRGESAPSRERCPRTASAWAAGVALVRNPASDWSTHLWRWVPGSLGRSRNRPGCLNHRGDPHAKHVVTLPEGQRQPQLY